MQSVNIKSGATWNKSQACNSLSSMPRPALTSVQKNF